VQPNPFGYTLTAKNRFIKFIILVCGFFMLYLHFLMAR
jgi:hypothetical protein